MKANSGDCPAVEYALLMQEELSALFEGSPVVHGYRGAKASCFLRGVNVAMYTSFSLVWAHELPDCEWQELEPYFDGYHVTLCLDKDAPLPMRKAALKLFLDYFHKRALKIEWEESEGLYSYKIAVEIYPSSLSF